MKATGLKDRRGLMAAKCHCSSQKLLYLCLGPGFLPSAESTVAHYRHLIQYTHNAGLISKVQRQLSVFLAEFQLYGFASFPCLLSRRHLPKTNCLFGPNESKSEFGEFRVASPM